VSEGRKYVMSKRGGPAFSIEVSTGSQHMRYLFLPAEESFPRMPDLQVELQVECLRPPPRECALICLFLCLSRPAVTTCHLLSRPAMPVLMRETTHTLARQHLLASLLLRISGPLVLQAGLVTEHPFTLFPR